MKVARGTPQENKTDGSGSVRHEQVIPNENVRT
jgi:hypothetical protein